MLKKTWLKCWHDAYLIDKAARLVVQNEAAIKIQVLYRDYRTRSKTAQLLTQKKKALLAKFVHQGDVDFCTNKMTFTHSISCRQCRPRIRCRQSRWSTYAWFDCKYDSPG
jgi:hypothetical protein